METGLLGCNLLISNTYDDAVSVKNLTKNYGSLTAVDNVSFDVGQGEVIGILGPNGAGKTTTLECIEGLLTPTRGQIKVMGIDPHQNPTTVKEVMGIQLQAASYFDYLTLQEILELFGRFYKKRISSTELLERVGLSDKYSSKLGQLSGGQKQRFTIAATLINDPDLIFLDEPTTGLDPHARRNVWDLIKSINRDGRTIILTTHYMEEAEYLCDRVAIMSMGRVIAIDAPENLVNMLKNTCEVRVLLSEGNNQDLVSTLKNTGPVTIDSSGLIRMASSDGVKTVSDIMTFSRDNELPITRLEIVPANLEQVFLAMTGRELDVDSSGETL